MSTLPDPLPSPGVNTPGSPPFFDRVRQTNPFTDNRVNGPSPADVDVDEVHKAAFDRLVDLAREAWQERRGLGAMLWGEAGVGKSHLLARLGRWAARDKHACFVYLHNLQASPDNLPRSILKAVVSFLTEGRTHFFRRTPLFRITNAAMRHALEKYAPGDATWTRLKTAYGLLLDELGAAPSHAALVDRTIYEVLFRFFRADWRSAEEEEDGTAELAVRWLSGDALDPDEARQLGLTPAGDEAVALADNQQVKQVLVALTQLAWFRRQPFVLAFDQVDNLETDQVAALARFQEALIDSSPNLLVVTSGVQSTLFDWLGAKVIQSSAWDRLAQFEIGVQRITPAEAERILGRRLERFVASGDVPETVAARRHEDAFFPLGSSWVQGVLGQKAEVRPRDALNWAREAWRRQQEDLRQVGGSTWLANWTPPAAPDVAARPMELTPEQVAEAIDRKIDQKLAEHQAERRRAPESLAPDAGNLSGLVQRLLTDYAPAGTRVFAVQPGRPAKRGRKRAYDLVVRRRESGREGLRIALVFLGTRSRQETTAALGRLVRDANPPERVLLITDERQPLDLAEKGEEHFEQLRRRGPERFQEVELSFERYAELDALQAMVGEARSGDLEVELPNGETRAVSEPEVIESHHRCGRYESAAILAEILRAPQAAGTSFVIQA